MLSDALALAGAALSLNRTALAAGDDSLGSGAGGLLRALLASLSLTFGQSLVLFANGVSRRPFVLCLLLLAAISVGALPVWAISIRLMSTYVLRWSCDPLRRCRTAPRA